jgi:hypothetical protein
MWVNSVHSSEFAGMVQCVNFDNGYVYDLRFAERASRGRRLPVSVPFGHTGHGKECLL